MSSSPGDDDFRLQLGTALKCCQEPYHRCVVASDPQNNGGIVVLLRITTDDGKWPDRDCILTPEEWGELEHASTVAYSTALCGRAEASLIKAIQAGEFQVISSPSLPVLRKIVTAGRASEGMPPKTRAFLVQL